MTLFPPTTERLDNALLGTLLVMARISGVFAISPFFSRKVMSRTVRLSIISSLSIIAAPMAIDALATAPANYFVLILKELMLGYFLGIFIWLPIRGLELAGVILDTQRGSSQAQDLDVVFMEQTTPTAILLSQIFAGYFFAAGGYLIVVSMVLESFKIWPPAAVLPTISKDAIGLFVKFAGMTFFTAVAMTLPISGFMLLADIVIAFIARTAQSLNALTFGMPVKSAVLLIMMISYLSILYPKIMETLSDSINYLSRVLAS